MSRPPSPPASPPLVSLVLHSKKALQHGEQLCTRASELSRCSSQEAVELLALDAKVRWIAQGIQDQLKLALNVAKTIEAQRNSLQEQAKQWDTSRTSYAKYLDSIFESLGSQHVPPEFYQSSSASSVFGSPTEDAFDRPDHENEADSQDVEENAPAQPRAQGLSASRMGTRSVRVNAAAKRVERRKDRTRWKTLRDFVDERGIEDAMERMENDRHALDDLLVTTSDYPHLIRTHVSSIQSHSSSGPYNQTHTPDSAPFVRQIFDHQERLSARMATHLESLAAHYEQMAVALRHKEDGEDFSEEDLINMNRDTEELPAIIKELEDDVINIESSLQQIQEAKQQSERSVSRQNEIIENLDELGDMMSEMLQHQQAVEFESQGHMETLHAHLSTLADLRMTYTSYQASYNNLVVEMDRRRQYRDAAEDIVKQMAQQLNLLREQELQTRALFDSTHGPNLPDDLCLSVTNLPTKWEVGPAAGEMLEILPAIEEDLLEEARKHVLLSQAGDASL